MIRILIIDDHPIICEGLSTLLSFYPDVTIAGVARDGAEGVEKLRQLRPDCVIVDLSMPGMSGIETIQACLREMPGIGVVVFTGHKSERDLYQALDAGARGYVLKGTALSNLVSALHEVHKGGCWLSPELSPPVIRRYLGKEGKVQDNLSEFETLSRREKEVFHLMAKGKSIKEIGAALFISIKTVSKHKIAIQHKLKLKNAVEMSNYAYKTGLIPPPPSCDREDLSYRLNSRNG